MPAFMIGAAHKSSGKTTISVGLSAALNKRKLNVQTFKKGPDYIDPMWLSLASNKSCYNLDFNTMDNDEILSLYAAKSMGKDISIIEANKGLFDGVELDGSDSNAQLAKLLKIPVILVIDTNGMTRGIAPLLLGYQNFDKELNIAGVILNKVGGSRHESKLRAAVAKYTDMKILGSIERNFRLDIGERHLGLTTPNETRELATKIDGFEEIISANVDLDSLIKIAKLAPAPPKNSILTTNTTRKKLRIGVIFDEAFGFYYADDLEEFKNEGAELIYINSLQDKALPKIDGLFIGGGFPEIHMQKLSANQSLREDIKKTIQAGLPTYAECGGLMYLCKSIEWNDKSLPMVGVVDAKALMHKKPQGRGYTIFDMSDNHLWGKKTIGIKAHEFHYASLENLPNATKFAQKIKRGHGIDGINDGIITHNLMAGFCHLRNSKSNLWVRSFLNFVYKKANKAYVI